MDEVLMYENTDLEAIITPIDVGKLHKLLKRSNYDKKLTKYICNGFKNGFSLEYQGSKEVRMTSRNLPLNIGTKTELWNKVMVEVEAKRYAGPFAEIPFENYIQSPIGLVPKDGGKKTRLIFHLSHPRKGDTSVNANIPCKKCKVKYPDFTEAVKMCLQAGVNCMVAKSDISRAFRNVPLNRESWRYLILKCENPIDKKVYFFVDKCLPFGASISCKIFQDISDCIAHIVMSKTLYPLLNYLDDYFFAALLKKACDEQVMVFLTVCKEVNFPVALEKTFWGNTQMVFLGMLLDTEKELIGIPIEKIQKETRMIEYFLEKSNKKATVLDFQKLTGILNFLSKSIVPGRAFTRRLYSGYSSAMLPHYHVRITEENKLDLILWKNFLMSPQVFSRPFLDMRYHTAEELDMYSDASGKKGVGAYCKKNWVAQGWDATFIEKYNPSIYRSTFITSLLPCAKGPLVS